MKQIVIAVLIAIMILPACRPVKPLVYQSIQNFSMEQGAKPTVTLDIRLINPNRYNLNLKSSDVEVMLNNVSLGKLRVEGKHAAPGLDTFLLPVKLEMNPKLSLQSLFPMFMTGDVHIKLSGTMKGGRHGIYKRVPVNYEGTENFLSNMK